MTVRQFGIFAQDEIAVAHDRLYLTIGARLEHYYYNGFALMPTVRAAWKVSKRDTLWAAVSRAIDTPDLNETTMRLNYNGFSGTNGTLFIPALIGNPHVENGLSVDYEMGYRSTVSKSLSLDFTAYFDQYSHLDSSEPGIPFFENQPAPAHIVLPTIDENLMHGGDPRSRRFCELEGIRSADAQSRILAFEQIHMHLDPGSQDTTSVAAAEGSTPVNSAQFRSHLFLSHGVAWDMAAYFVGRIADPVVPSYTRLDTGLTWQAAERLSFSIFGQNLLQEERLEYVDTLGSTAPTLVKRGAYAKMRWTF